MTLAELQQLIVGDEVIWRPDRKAGVVVELDPSFGVRVKWASGHLMWFPWTSHRRHYEQLGRAGEAVDQRTLQERFRDLCKGQEGEQAK